MIYNDKKHLLLGITGGSGSYAAKLLIERSVWPVDIILSDWGKYVMKYENIEIKTFINKSYRQFKNTDLSALPSSGSISCVGMIVLPCSTKTLGEIATGTGNNLISRAAHCQLKERRTLILCLRESPLTSINIDNVKKITDAGGIVMPITPPFFMFDKCNPHCVSMHDLLIVFIDRVLSLLGQKNLLIWEGI